MVDSVSKNLVSLSQMSATALPPASDSERIDIAAKNKKSRTDEFVPSQETIIKIDLLIKSLEEKIEKPNKYTSSDLALFNIQLRSLKEFKDIPELAMYLHEKLSDSKYDKNQEYERTKLTLALQTLKNVFETNVLKKYFQAYRNKQSQLSVNEIFERFFGLVKLADNIGRYQGSGRAKNILVKGFGLLITNNTSEFNKLLEGASERLENLDKKKEVGEKLYDVQKQLNNSASLTESQKSELINQHYDLEKEEINLRQEEIKRLIPESSDTEERKELETLIEALEVQKKIIDKNQDLKVLEKTLEIKKGLEEIKSSSGEKDPGLEEKHEILGKQLSLINQNIDLLSKQRKAYDEFLGEITGPHKDKLREGIKKTSLAISNGIKINQAEEVKVRKLRTEIGAALYKAGNDKYRNDFECFCEVRLKYEIPKEKEEQLAKLNKLKSENQSEELLFKAAQNCIEMTSKLETDLLKRKNPEEILKAASELEQNIGLMFLLRKQKLPQKPFFKQHEMASFVERIKAASPEFQEKVDLELKQCQQKLQAIITDIVISQNKPLQEVVKRSQKVYSTLKPLLDIIHYTKAYAILEKKENGKTLTDEEVKVLEETPGIKNGTKFSKKPLSLLSSPDHLTKAERELKQSIEQTGILADRGMGEKQLLELQKLVKGPEFQKDLRFLKENLKYLGTTVKDANGVIHGKKDLQLIASTTSDLESTFGENGSISQLVDQIKDLEPGTGWNKFKYWSRTNGVIIGTAVTGTVLTLSVVGTPEGLGILGTMIYTSVIGGVGGTIGSEIGKEVVGLYEPGFQSNIARETLSGKFNSETWKEIGLDTGKNIGMMFLFSAAGKGLGGAINKGAMSNSSWVNATRLNSFCKTLQKAGDATGKLTFEGTKYGVLKLAGEYLQELGEEGWEQLWANKNIKLSDNAYIDAGGRFVLGSLASLWNSMGGIDVDVRVQHTNPQLEISIKPVNDDVIRMDYRIKTEDAADFHKQRLIMLDQLCKVYEIDSNSITTEETPNGVTFKFKAKIKGKDIDVEISPTKEPVEMKNFRVETGGILERDYGVNFNEQTGKYEVKNSSPEGKLSLDKYLEKQGFVILSKTNSELTVMFGGEDIAIDIVEESKPAQEEKARGKVPPNTGQIIPTLEQRRKILTSDPEVFQKYPELAELGRRMLAFGSIENLNKAIENGQINPQPTRDEVAYLKELEKTDPGKAQRLRFLLEKSTKHTELLEILNTIKREDIISGIPTDGIKLSGLEHIKLKPELQEVETKIKKLLKEVNEASARLDAEFPATGLIEDFGISGDDCTFTDFKYAAELGKLLGYKPEDILVFGIKTLLNNLAGDSLCTLENGGATFEGKIKILDREFLNEFFQNARKWAEKHPEAKDTPSPSAKRTTIQTNILGGRITYDEIPPGAKKVVDFFESQTRFQVGLLILDNSGNPTKIALRVPRETILQNPNALDKLLSDISDIEEATGYRIREIYPKPAYEAVPFDHINFVVDKVDQKTNSNQKPVEVKEQTSPPKSAPSSGAKPETVPSSVSALPEYERACRESRGDIVVKPTEKPLRPGKEAISISREWPSGKRETTIYLNKNLIDALAEGKDTPGNEDAYAHALGVAKEELIHSRQEIIDPKQLKGGAPEYCARRARGELEARKEKEAIGSAERVRLEGKLSEIDKCFESNDYEGASKIAKENGVDNDYFNFFNSENDTNMKPDREYLIQSYYSTATLPRAETKPITLTPQQKLVLNNTVNGFEGAMRDDSLDVTRINTLFNNRTNGYLLMLQKLGVGVEVYNPLLVDRLFKIAEDPNCSFETISKGMAFARTLGLEDAYKKVILNRVIDEIDKSNKIDKKLRQALIEPFDLEVEVAAHLRNTNRESLLAGTGIQPVSIAQRPAPPQPIRRRTSPPNQNDNDSNANKPKMQNDPPRPAQKPILTNDTYGGPVDENYAEFSTNDLVTLKVMDGIEPSSVISNNLSGLAKLTGDETIEAYWYGYELLLMTKPIDPAKLKSAHANILKRINELVIKLDTKNRPELESKLDAIQRNAGWAQKEARIKNVLDTLAPEEGRRSDIGWANKNREQITRLLDTSYISQKTFDDNLSCLEKLAEVVQNGGIFNNELLIQLQNKDTRTSAAEHINKLHSHFQNITRLETCGVKVPKEFRINSSSDHYQNIINNALKILNPDNEGSPTKSLGERKAESEGFLTYELCTDPQIRNLADIYDSTLNNSTTPNYSIRARIVDFLESRNNGYKTIAHNGQAQIFVQHVINLMSSNNPQGKPIHGASRLFDQVYERNHKSIDNDHFYGIIAGHLWNAECALQMMKEGYDVKAISVGSEEEINAIKNNTLIPKQKGTKLRAKGDKSGRGREIDIVAIKNGELYFIEAKTSQYASDQAQVRSVQDEALKDIAEQFDAIYQKRIKR